MLPISAPFESFGALFKKALLGYGKSRNKVTCESEGRIYELKNILKFMSFSL